MTKDVLIRIGGLQFQQEGQEKVEVINSGSYYFKNQKHYILYDEAIEGFSEPNKNKIKIDQGIVEVQKKGPITVQMVFDEKNKHISYYQTPYGSMEMGIDTKKVELREKDDQMDLKIEYSLEINQEHLAECNIEISIMSKDSASFHL